MSSKKRMCERGRVWLAVIPFRAPYLISLWINLLNPSTTCKNRRGDNGKPWRRPISTFKKVEAKPFKSTAKEVVLMQLRTHVTKE